MPTQGPFVIITFDILKRDNISPADKLVLGYLQYRIGNNDKCWPGITTIGKELALNRSTVIRCIERLAAKGDILVTRPGHGKVNHYQLADPNQAQNAPSRNLPPGAESNHPQAQNAPAVGAKCAQNQAQNAPQRERTIKRTSEKNKTRGRSPSLLPEAPLPVALDQPAFRKAWADWQTHLKQKKKPPTALATDLQIAKCERLGPAEAVRWLNWAIEHNWQGLYEPQGNTNATNTNRRPAQSGDILPPSNFDHLVDDPDFIPL